MPILDAVREAARSDIWSRGVTLARGDGVIGVSETTNEFILRVTQSGKGKCCTVHLWPLDPDWSCDCAATLRPCLHIAAAAITLRRSKETGGGFAATQENATSIGYRLSRTSHGLRIDRVALTGEQEQPLTGALEGNHDGGPRLIYGDSDLAAEKALAHRFGVVIPRERVPRLFRAINDSDDVTLDGEPIEAAVAPVVPLGWVEDHGEGFRLRIVRDPSIDEVFRNGIVRCEKAVHAIGDGSLSREQRTVLGRGVVYTVSDVGQLVSETLPRLKEKIPVHIKTKRLPSIDQSPPRLVLQTKRTGDTLIVQPAVVYGDPPIARLTNERLELLGDQVPIRNLRAERRLIQRLGQELRMAIGLETRLKGAAAVRFVDRIDRLPIDVIGKGYKAFRRVDAIVPSIEVDQDRLLADMGGANPDDVIRAWLDGDKLVSMPNGGGWAEIPTDWLNEHGHLVADLLAARDENGRVARYALFDLARLCEELDHPPPPGLDGIRTLVDDFAGIPEHPLPEGFTGTLRGYQTEGVNWLAFMASTEMGSILADDMGLGKTIQALCVVDGRTLVVAPRSVLHNWSVEAARFRPDLSVHIYHGPHRKLNDKADITITTYALLRGDSAKLQAIDWKLVILDEAQAIKNPESQVAQAAFGLPPCTRITMTGTPVENRLDELWSQMHFVNPGLLGGRRDFDDRYSQPIARGEQRAAARLRERIRPFLLRRLKKEVAPELPPRTDLVLRCVLSESERAIYDAIRLATQARVAEQMGATNVMAALEALLRLRQAACHSDLIPGQSADSSSKIDLLIETLNTIVPEGHKALVFSQWTSLLNRLEPHLHEAEIPFIRLDGSTRDRGGVVDQFQSDDGPPIMLISLKAGGTGLNLTAADHVFLLDPWWNPAAEDQAADRTHRIGQDKPVLVYRLVAENTVEERILALQAKKRAIAQAALGEAGQAAGITKADLLALLTG
jgi:superfamily II DNA or RNA helicase